MVRRWCLCKCNSRTSALQLHLHVQGATADQLRQQRADDLAGRSARVDPGVGLERFAVEHDHAGRRGGGHAGLQRQQPTRVHPGGRRTLGDHRLRRQRQPQQFRRCHQRALHPRPAPCTIVGMYTLRIGNGRVIDPARGFDSSACTSTIGRWTMARAAEKRCVCCSTRGTRPA
jgi:hypothetical protein